MKTFLLFLLCLFPVSRGAYSDDEYLVIMVNQTTGVDNSTCEKGEIPCKTINKALKILENLFFQPVKIDIACGMHILAQGNETNITSSDVNITGCGRPNQTVIYCNTPTGIRVKESTNVVIKSLTFQGCGQVTKLNNERLIQFAIFIQDSLITLSDIIITDSLGTGLVLSGGPKYGGPAIIENMAIQHCQASMSISTKQSIVLRSGGIVFLSVAWAYILRNIQVVNSTFYSNIACFPKGGAVTIIGSDNTANITIDSCSIAGLVAYNMIESTLIIRKTNIGFDDSVNSFIQMDLGWYFVSVIDMIDTNIPDGFTVYYSNISLKSNINAISSPEDFRVLYEFEDMLNFSMTWYSKSTINLTLPKITYDDQCYQTTKRGTCSNFRHNNYMGHCPVFYSNCSIEAQSLYYCANNHIGELCGGCVANPKYSITVNSPILTCSLCHDTSTIVKGWIGLIVLQILPITVMTTLIAILYVNLNQGSLNAYILFSQILTISFPSVGYPSWIVMENVYSIVDVPLVKFLLFPFSIWNLDFSSVLSCFTNDCKSGFSNICISQGTTALGVLVVWYCLAVYPIMLLGVFYVCIHFYNKGNSCFVVLFRPLHRLLARFWRLFDIQPSLTRTIASIYSLCFTQLAAISLKILHPTWYYGKNGERVIAFFYDGSQKYFTTWHIPAVLASIAVLSILFGITIYLLLYPFRWFQRFIAKTKLKNAFIVSICDVFMGPFNEGFERKSIDLRIFAGIHFIFRLIIMMLYYIPQKDNTLFIIPLIEVSLCIILTCSVIIFRPYKRAIHNLVEAFFLVVLGLLSLGYFFGENIVRSREIFSYVVFTTLLVVLVMVIPYCLMWMVVKCRKAYRYLLPIIKLPTTNNTDNDDEDNQLVEETVLQDDSSGNEAELADRLLNPDRYNSNSPEYYPAIAGLSLDNRTSTNGDTNTTLRSSRTTYETFIQ